MTTCPDCGVDDASGLHPCRPQVDMLDQFAMAALTGLLSFMANARSAKRDQLDRPAEFERFCARSAYDFAEACIAERGRRRDAAREGA